jgi:hypothetical protein
MVRARGAAWLAHWTVNPEAAGSSPVEPAIKTKGLGVHSLGPLLLHAFNSWPPTWSPGRLVGSVRDCLKIR